MSMEQRSRLPDGVKRHAVFGSNERPFSGMAWSPDGLKIACSLHIGGIDVWKLKQQTVTHLFPDDHNKLECVSWSPDGRRLACGTAGGGLLLGSESRPATLAPARHDHSITTIGWSPDGARFATGSMDFTLRVWDSWKREVLRTIRTRGVVNHLDWSTVGIAAAITDGTLALFDPGVLSTVKMLPGHAGPSLATAWRPGATMFASAGSDRTIRIWDSKGMPLLTLEGHTGLVNAISFSPDGEFLASTATDGTVRLWKCSSWESVAIIEPGMDGDGLRCAFHPTNSILAVAAPSAGIVHLYDVDAAHLSRTAPTAPTVRYSNARIVLVGDTSIGKSGLALVLTNRPWAPTESTHSRRVWVFPDETNEPADDIREAFLWDLAGQPDYRPIHQLHMTEVAVALLVFDARSSTDPFAGVRHWDRALRQARQAHGEPAWRMTKLLVAARTDVGRINASASRIEELVRLMGFDGYIETSAKEGWGIEELKTAIRQGIDWDSLPKISSTMIFQGIRSFLITQKESGRLLSSLEDLYHLYRKSDHAPREAIPDLESQFETCIQLVESRGLIHRLSFGNLILLQPELRDAYAAAMVNAARDDRSGLGCIPENKARTGEFRLPASERISNREQEKLLLISTIEDLLLHEIALREDSVDGAFLVFPSQLTRENHTLKDPSGKAVIFEFEGPVVSAYATLTVRLSHSGFFTKKDLWKDVAIFNAPGGGTCGILLQEHPDGMGELTLFFDGKVTDETRFHFEEFVRAHLERRSLPDTIQRKRVFNCPSCGNSLPGFQVEERRKRHHRSIQCPICDFKPISILDQADPSQQALLRPKLSAMERAADARLSSEKARLMLEGKMEVSDFDVFLCYNTRDKEAVKEMGTRLKDEGILPWLDEWELRPGLPWVRVLEEQIGRVRATAVIIGADGEGPWQREEIEAFLREFVDRGCPVIPVLLPEAPEEPDLPVFLRGRTWVDFRKSDPDPFDQLLWGITGARTWVP